jgi:hypothetical protein
LAVTEIYTYFIFNSTFPTVAVVIIEEEKLNNRVSVEQAKGDKKARSEVHSPLPPQP